MLVGWATHLPTICCLLYRSHFGGQSIAHPTHTFQAAYIINTFLQILLTKIICKYIYLRKLTNKQHNFTLERGSITDFHATLLFGDKLC